MMGLIFFDNHTTVQKSPSPGWLADEYSALFKQMCGFSAEHVTFRAFSLHSERSVSYRSEASVSERLRSKQ